MPRLQATAPAGLGLPGRKRCGESQQSDGHPSPPKALRRSGHCSSLCSSFTPKSPGFPGREGDPGEQAGWEHYYQEGEGDGEGCSLSSPGDSIASLLPGGLPTAEGLQGTRTKTRTGTAPGGYRGPRTRSQPHFPAAARPPAHFRVRARDGPAGAGQSWVRPQARAPPLLRGC